MPLNAEKRNKRYQNHAELGPCMMTVLLLSPLPSAAQPATLPICCQQPSLYWQCRQTLLLTLLDRGDALIHLHHTSCTHARTQRRSQHEPCCTSRLLPVLPHLPCQDIKSGAGGCAAQKQGASWAAAGVNEHPTRHLQGSAPPQETACQHQILQWLGWPPPSHMPGTAQVPFLQPWLLWGQQD